MFVSPAVRRAFGLDDRALVSARSVDHSWIHEEDRGRFVSALHHSADTLTPLDEEVRVLVDGGVRWVRSLGDPVQEGDGTVIWDGVALDVTDRKVAMERVREAMELARAAEVAASAQGLSKASPAALAKLVEALWPASGHIDVASARAATRTICESAGLNLPPAEPPTLTNRQSEIASMVAGGASNKDVADALGLSEGTVKLHVSRILERLGLKNRRELMLHPAAFR